MTATTTLTLVDGVRVVVPDSLDCLTTYVLHEQQDWFEAELPFLRRVLLPGEQVIDIGANLGVYSLSLARAVGATGRVWAFEPAAATAARLAESIAANGFAHVQLERSAVGATAGSAALMHGAGSEFHALARDDATPGERERVSVVTLDERMQALGWADIACVKIDAEGAEPDILAGGARCFAALSPLVQYEIRDGAGWHLDLVAAFAALGYTSYRLVPGLALLVPFDAKVAPDPSLLNLFCCKPDRAERLAERGLLLRPAAAARATRPGAGAGLPANSRDWRRPIAALPYGRVLAPRWERTVPAGRSDGVLAALADYAASRDPTLVPAARFQALQASYDRLRALCEGEPTHLRLASLARVAADLGHRAVAAQALARLIDGLQKTGGLDLSEPFLVPEARFEGIPPGPAPADWVLAAVLEGVERLGALSSYFGDAATLRRLGLMRRLGFASPEMERRWTLLQRRLGRPGDAADGLDGAATPADDAASARADAARLRRQRRFAEALATARRAVALAPDDPDGLCLLGLCLLDTGDGIGAAAPLRRAVALDPKLADAHIALGAIAWRASRHAEAEGHFVAAIEAAPEGTAALCNLAAMLGDSGRGDEAAALLAPAAAGLPGDITLQQALAVAANYDPTQTPAQVAAQHRRYGAAVRAKLPAEALRPLPRPVRAPGTPLRVGFLSPDLREHSVAAFLLPLLAHLDRARVRPFAYFVSTHADAVTERFRATVADFVDCGALPDLALVQRVRADGLDLLVDCAGLFNGGRPAALAARLAPVQATWLGYPNTTGLPNLDVRLVDGLTDPPGAEALATERLARLDGCFVCWQARDPVPLPVRDPARPLTFGCFNALSKVHDALLGHWARLLGRVPGSRLLLKAQPLADPDIAGLIRERFAAEGIDPGRLDLRGHTATQAEHLALYGEVDIALDTFPYNGTTTTCEALWMGTPVVTLAGQGHPARVGVSLLTAAGCADWIAADPDGYVALAAGLAADRTALAAQQRGLRARLAASQLCNAADFARRFAEALERC